MILKVWQRLSRIPGGKTIFRILVGWWVPYTGSLLAQVEELRPGYARVTLKDRRRLRNHLGSIHAAALMNLGEYASGIAMIAGLPSEVRGIVIQFHIRYLKKARGTLTAVSECVVPKVVTDTDYKVAAKIFNVNQELIAETEATWRLSPTPR